MAFVNALAAPLVAGGDKIPMAISGGKVRVALAEFTFAADAVGTYACPELQFAAGTRILDVQFNLSASAGASATLALGIAGDTGKYRAAAVLTTAGAWVASNLNAATGAVLTAAEAWLLTVAVAALPASGRMLIRVLYVDNS